ncbi:MAG: protein kinase [Alphaproteobacteria bacterium]|nr:protein kinase [Alphaproteobacteria bacterium]
MTDDIGPGAPPDGTVSRLTWGELLSDDASDADVRSTEPEGGVHLGRYALRGQLGRGGMGVVFRAWDPRLGREVALKLLYAGHISNANQRRRFQREARAVARLRHPHIVEVYDIGEHEGSVFFAMRLIEGENLARRLKKGPMAEREAARLALQLARALAHAHAHGFVHRDVKPSNVLLDGEDAVLVDFGLVKDPEESVALTQDGRAMGTPAYMSPEQARGDLEAISPASDQYGLGAVLYEALSGFRPFIAPSPLEVMRRVLDEEPISLERFEVDAGLARIVRRAMAKAPQDRFADLGEMADALERWLEDGSPLSSTSDISLRLRSAARQHRWPLLLVAMGLALVVALVGGSRLQARRAVAQHEAAAAQRRAVLTETLDIALDDGRFAEAERAFAGFTRSPENQGTEALAAAWLDWGRRMAELGHPEDAREALGVAYVLSTKPERQDDALVALAALFRAQDDFPRLAPTIAALEARGSTRLAAPPVQELRRDLAVAQGDLAGALALEPRPKDRALISTLAHATPLATPGQDAQLWDSDGDGLPELLVFQPEPPRFVLIDPRDPDAPPLATGPAPEWGFRLSWAELMLEPGRPQFMVLEEDGCRVFSREGADLVPGARFPCQTVADATAADLDQDGRSELYVAGPWSLHRVLWDRDDLDWTTEEVPTSLNQTQSILHRVTVGDADGDGRPELFTAADGWGAYDLRALVPDGDGLAMRARARIGAVAWAETLTWAGRPAVAAYQEFNPDRSRNRRIFGEGRPDVETTGLHVLRLDERGFTRAASFPWPTPPMPADASAIFYSYQSGDHFRVADLDGDGDDELVALPAPGWSWVFFRRADGSLGELALRGTVVLDAGDVDGDGEDELVARAEAAPHQLMLVGLGQDAPPRSSLHVEVARTHPPRDLDAALQQRWSLAEDLVTIGLLDVAARQLLESTALATDPLTAGRLRLRAAVLLEQTGAQEEALEAFERAAEEPTLAAQALEGAFRCAEGALRLERALRAGRARLDLPDPPSGLQEETRALAVWLDTRPQSFDFAQGIDPLWQVEGASELRTDPVAGGLRVRSARQREHLALRLRWGEGRKRVRVTVSPSRVDWGASFRLNFKDGPINRHSEDDLRLAGRGGGESYDLEHYCPWSYTSDLIARPLPRSEPDAPLVIDWESDAAGTRASCTVTQGDQSVRRVYTPSGAYPDGAEMTLTLDTRSIGNALSDVLLHKIELWGATPIPRDAEPDEAARRAFVDGRTTEALALLEEVPRDDPSLRLLRVLALAELGDGARARQELTALLREHPDQRERLPTLLVTAPERYAPLLQQVLGDDYFTAFYEASSTIVYQHPREQQVLAPLLIWLEGLSDSRVPGLTPEALEARIWLLARRGEAARRQGRLTEARRDLEQALAMAAEAPGTPWTWEPVTLARAWSELGLVRWALHDGEGAFEALERALATAGAPEVFADTLAVSPDFAALRAEPRWAAVEAARRHARLEDEPAP